MEALRAKRVENPVLLIWKPYGLKRVENPHSCKTIHHSSFIIHHSSFIIHNSSFTMERRRFIKRASLLAAGMAAGAKIDAANAFINVEGAASGAAENEAETAKASSVAAATGLRRSIMWGTIGVKGTILEKCKAVKAAGYDGVEPNSHDDRNAILDAVKETGLTFSSVCNSKHWNVPLSHPEAAVRKQGVEAMVRAMEDAKFYGTDAVLLVPGKVDDATPYDVCWKRSTECIRELIPAAEELKIKMCIENVWNGFLLSPLEAARYVDQFESRYVKFYFDCGNILHYGAPDQWIRILGSRIGRIHIKEYSEQKANKEGKWAGFGAKLTEGDVPWDKVMQQIVANYEGGWLTTEMGTGDSLEGVKDLLQRLDKIIAMA
jgi:hexulose-6-phosphate isomerase